MMIDLNKVGKKLLEYLPLLAIFFGGMAWFGETWVDQRVDALLKDRMALTDGGNVTEEVTLLRDDVEDLEGSISKLDGSVQELNQDVKAVLLHLAGQ